MKLKINSAKLVPDKYGNNVLINRIGLYEDDGKFIKWVKLNDELLKVITQTYIQL